MTRLRWSSRLRLRLRLAGRGAGRWCCLVSLLGGLSSGLLGPRALAQTEVPGDTSLPSISPRLRVGYRTQSGGLEAMTQFEGFLPFGQSVQSSDQYSVQTLWFLEGKLLLDPEAQIGGNLLVGYRQYDAGSDRLWGGYVAYDDRRTAHSQFSQLGVGFETIGDWELRLNGYIPLGDRRDLVASSSLDSGLQLSNLRFQGNFLLADGQQQRQTTRVYDATMGGVDLEVGGKLTPGGTLRAYVGGYYSGAPGSDDILGWRLRVAAEPSPGLDLGLMLQDDARFGTRLVASVGLSWPPRAGQRSSQRSNQQRLGDSVARTDSIVLDRQVERAVTGDSFAGRPLTNPATGSAYVFQHVLGGGTAGNGTFEAPFNAMDGAIAASRLDGNGIIYVQPGTNLGFTGFTIPTQVQVLSTGPIQQIATVERSWVTLPLSGQGTLAQVNGTVTMGDRSVLSGFTVTGGTGPAVLAQTLSSATVRDSRLFSSAIAGAQVSNTSGTVSFLNTPIIGEGVPSLIATNVVNLAIANSSLTSRNSISNGLQFNGVSGTITPTNSPIQISNAQTAGIQLTGIQGTVNLSNATINQTGQAGVELADSPGAIALDRFTIQTTGDSGILGRNLGSLSFTNSSINTAVNQGIFLDRVSASLTLTDNQIRTILSGTRTLPNPIQGNLVIPTPLGNFTIPNPGATIPLPAGQGIVTANITGPVTISRNAITNTATQGMVLLTGQGQASLENNVVSNTIGADATIASSVGNLLLPTGQGIVVGNWTGGLVLNNNLVSNTRGQGIVLSGVTGSGNPIRLTGNAINQALNQGIELLDTDGDIAIANNTITNTLDSLVNLPAVPLLGSINVPQGQGIALGDVTGNLSITANRIEGTKGQLATTTGVPPSGQGIFLLNLKDSLNLTINENQIRTNFNDGILVGLLDTATLTATINNNVIANNGGAAPVRGDGIAIGLEQASRLTGLTIKDNTIQSNGDEGIDIRLGQTSAALGIASTAILINGTIQGNAIANNAQNGIQLSTFLNTQATTSILNNNLTGNGAGVLIPVVQNSRVCLNLVGNVSTTASTLTRIEPATFQVVNLGAIAAQNTGAINTVGVLTGVLICP